MSRHRKTVKKGMSRQEIQLAAQVQELNEHLGELKIESDDLMVRHEVLTNQVRFLRDVLRYGRAGLPDESQTKARFLTNLLAIIQRDTSPVGQSEVSAAGDESHPDPPDREEAETPIVNESHPDPPDREEAGSPIVNESHPDPPDREEAGSPIVEEAGIPILEEDQDPPEEQGCCENQCGEMQSFATAVAEDKGGDDDKTMQ